MSDYKYKAFISYRHLEPDMQAAEKLQKLLDLRSQASKIFDAIEFMRDIGLEF